MHFLALLKAGWKALSQRRLEEGICRDKASGRRGRGGKTAPVRRNVEGQKEQRMKFHSGLKQPTTKGAGRLAVPPGLPPSLWAWCWCCWKPLASLATVFSSKKKKKNWCAEWGNKAGFCNKRNLPSTAQGILWGISGWPLPQCLKNISISVEYP